MIEMAKDLPPQSNKFALRMVIILLIVAGLLIRLLFILASYNGL